MRWYMTSMMTTGTQKVSVEEMKAYGLFTRNTHSSGFFSRHFWWSAVVYQPRNMGRNEIYARFGSPVKIRALISSRVPRLTELGNLQVKSSH